MSTRGDRTLSPAQRNGELLSSMAYRMGELRERVVFLGGAVLSLLITDPDVQAVRIAKDVDAVLRWSDKKDLYAFEDGLWSRGFEKCANGSVSRWLVDHMALDVLPANPATVGFDARWLDEAWATATPVKLGDDVSVKIVSPPVQLAVKLVAFMSRGRGNYFASPDIADVVVLCAGRSQVGTEAASYPNPQLRDFLREQLQALQAAFVKDNRAARQGRYLKLVPKKILDRALQRVETLTAM
jgi:hypothetical protein